MFYFKAGSHFVVDQGHDLLLGGGQELHSVHSSLREVVDKVRTLIDLKNVCLA